MAEINLLDIINSYRESMDDDFYIRDKAKVSIDLPSMDYDPNERWIPCVQM